MAQPTAAVPDFRTPRQFLDVRGFTQKLILRRSWFIGFVLLDILIIYAILSDPILIDTWNYIWPGIAITVQITAVSFVLATIIGLITALMRISKNVFIYNISTFYVELFRGLPLLVIILVFSFVITPAFIDFIVTVPALDNLIQQIAGINPAVIQTTLLRTRD
ncbi:MAG: ABC transporter permease subunit, partial [Chloroflexota bacterium]